MGVIFVGYLRYLPKFRLDFSSIHSFGLLLMSLYIVKCLLLCLVKCFFAELRSGKKEVESKNMISNLWQVIRTYLVKKNKSSLITVDYPVHFWIIDTPSPGTSSSKTKILVPDLITAGKLFQSSLIYHV